VRTLRDAQPYVVDLSGTGEPNRLPVLHLSATSMGFGNTFVGLPVTREVTLQNAGLAPLVVSSILVDGAFFADLGCLTTIAPGTSCTLRVTFLPGAPGGQSAGLEIRSNAADSPHRVGLGGTGCFIPTPSRARFGGLLCGG
jgi:trimeric autotransporter adhesin